MLPSYWREIGGVEALAGLRLSTLTMSDGRPTTIYEFGRASAPLLLIVNPYAYPFALLGPLASVLGQWFHVASWENRTAPFLEPPDGESPLSVIDRLAKDLAEVAAAFGAGPSHVLAWCDGAHIATSAAATFDTPFRTMSFISPVDIGMPAPEAQRALMALLAQARGPGADKRLAGVLNIFRISTRRRPAGSALDRQIWSLCDLNFGSVETVGRFANALQAVSEFAPLRDGEDLRGRHRRLFEVCAGRSAIQILHCEDDEMVPVQSSRDAARLAEVRLDIEPRGGHHAGYRRPELWASSIRDFAFAALADAPAG